MSISYKYKKNVVQFNFSPTIVQLNTLFEVKKVCFLNLSVCYITDEMVAKVPAFSDLIELDLSLTKVTKASPFSKITKLNLSYTKVKDASALGNVDTLNLSFTKVEDFSAVENVRNLIR